MSRLLDRLLLVVAVSAPLLLVRLAFADLPVTFQEPHSARVGAAVLDDDFSRLVDTRMTAAKIVSVDELVMFSLGMTAADLHFGLDHKTTLRFGAKEREGNCVEYAHLFATIFNRAAEKKQVAARAYVVRSDARVFGKKMATPALNDHDWVLVVPNGVVPSGARSTRLFVDPTLYDFGLDWDIARRVSGEVRLP